jgi:hypothetical protein
MDRAVAKPAGPAPHTSTSVVDGREDSIEIQSEVH